MAEMLAFVRECRLTLHDHRFRVSEYRGYGCRPGRCIRTQEEGGLQVNKNDLVSAVANSAGLSKSDATKAVDGVFDAISGALQGGDEVRLVGFGTFSVAARAASEGRNPRTGDKITIPASKLPKFKAGKGLKDSVQ